MGLFNKTEREKLFWKWFKKNEKYIYHNFESSRDQISAAISNKLKKVDKNLTYEISTLKEGEKKEFVISADGLYESFDNVIALFNSAPSFSRWVIIPFRPRMSSRNIGIKMGDFTLSYEDIYFEYDEKDIYVNMKIYIDNYNENDDRYVSTFFILLDALVGEYDAVTKIGEIKIFSLENGEKDELYEFEELIDIIDRLKQ